MLKILACLLMLTDHIGLTFFPNDLWIRIIGRLAMPIFAYAIARGAYYTHDRKKYILRMAILAVVSQVPFAFLVKSSLLGDLNICFTWLFTLLIIELWENKNLLKSLKYIFIGIIILITIFVRMDYGLYAVLLALLFYQFDIRTKRFIMIPLLYVIISFVPIATDLLQNFSMSNLPTYMFEAAIEFFSILSLIIIRYLGPYDKKLKINKYVFYYFYPVHIAIIVLVAHFL